MGIITHMLIVGKIMWTTLLHNTTKSKRWRRSPKNHSPTPLPNIWHAKTSLLYLIFHFFFFLLHLFISQALEQKPQLNLKLWSSKLKYLQAFEVIFIAIKLLNFLEPSCSSFPWISFALL